MSQLDTWVTAYEGRICDVPARHIYRCVPEAEFSDDVYYVGAYLTIDDSTYMVCGLEEVDMEEGLWHLAYVHSIPDSMTEKEWHELYGNP
jgi:hypothetical protein